MAENDPKIIQYKHHFRTHNDEALHEPYDIWNLWTLLGHNWLASTPIHLYLDIYFKNHLSSSKLIVQAVDPLLAEGWNPECTTSIQHQQLQGKSLEEQPRIFWLVCEKENHWFAILYYQHYERFIILDTLLQEKHHYQSKLIQVAYILLKIYDCQELTRYIPTGTRVQHAPSGSRNPWHIKISHSTCDQNILNIA